MTEWPTLDEAAAALGKSTRTLFRWLADGRLVRTTRPDGTPVFTLVEAPDGSTGDDTDVDTDGGTDEETPADMAENDVSLTAELASAERPRGRPPTPPTPAVAAVAVAVTEARARVALRRLAGPAFLALLDLASALDALAEGAADQVNAEAWLSVADPDPGQAGYDGWRRLADPIAAALADIQTMLNRQVIDDGRLAALDLALRRTERTWAAAREYDVTHAPGDAVSVVAVRRRAQREAHLFGTAAEALRRALIE